MALPSGPAKRIRRSYNCGPCKKHKIKCDTQIPCGNCTRYHREQACRDCPPNPPTREQLLKKKERRKKYFEKKTRDLFIQHSVGVAHRESSSTTNISSSNNSINMHMHQGLQPQSQHSSMNLPSIIHHSPYTIPSVITAYAEPQRNQLEQPASIAKHNNVNNISNNDDNTNDNHNISGSHEYHHFIPYQQPPPCQQMVTQQNLSMLDCVNESQRSYQPLEVQHLHAPPTATTLAGDNSIPWNLRLFAKARGFQDPNYEINGSNITLVNNSNDNVNNSEGEISNPNTDTKINTPTYSKYSTNIQQAPVAPKYSEQLLHYQSNPPLKGGSELLPALGDMPVHNNIPVDNSTSMPSMQANVGFQQSNAVDYEGKPFTQQHIQHPQLLNNASMNISSSSSATIVNSSQAPDYVSYHQNQSALLNTYESTTPNH